MSKSSASLLLLCLLFVVAPAYVRGAETPRELAVRGLKFREIGPAVMGGRVDDLAVVESDPKTMYLGLASGGVWKTVNAFTTAEPIFDAEEVSSIGAITVAPSDPSIVWVGTGEANTRQSSSWGNGVYRSMDAGKTWQHLGLNDTHHIGRILVHPRNPNVVYVAAQGHLWGPNQERGLYKTSDSGKTWTRVLFISENTGVTDIAMDRNSPDTLYAAAYERRRTAGGFNGGGVESALYKTVDGGEHWTKLTEGLPKGGDTGRIAVDIYRRNPRILYALVEHAQGGVFRSTDSGSTWTKMSSTNPRPDYFSQIRIDPNNDQRIWLGGTSLMASDDGGKTFRNSTLPTSNGVRGSLHEDFHAQWIDPADSDHMVTGNDGGVQTTWDGGIHWTLHNNLPIGQFYGISFDYKRPYNVCGGLQDNDSWCGPSSSLIIRGISNDEWLKVGGGDGMYSQIDAKDPNWIYSESQDGNLTRRDLRIQQSLSIRPREPDEQSPRYRFQWTSPFLLSHFDDKTLYIGGNYVFKSTDRGESWTRLGEDLTSGADRTRIAILDRMPDKDTISRNDGVSSFPNITTLSESPVRPGILWAGTDDGNLQVSKDGKNWKNVASNVPGIPKGTYVSRVLASKYAEGTAFATFDGHRGNDFNPYVFVTTDFGEHWTDISNGLPHNTGTVHVIVEHFRNQNLLFAGTELGLFLSFDRGKNWQELKNNLPRVPVFDLQIHPRENDLIVGTHGRSIWLLDDLTPLEQLTDEVLATDAHLFEVRPAVEWHLMDAKTAIGHEFFVADNPPYGALLNYYLKTAIDKDKGTKIEILDKSGQVVRTLSDVGGAATINRVAWDLRTDPPVPPAPQEGNVRRGGTPRGMLVAPGEYNVRLTAGAAQMSKTVLVEDDARINLATEDRITRTNALKKLYQMAKESNTSERQLAAVRTAVTEVQNNWKKPGSITVPDGVKKALEEFTKKMDAIEKTAEADVAAGSVSARYVPPPISQRINRLMSAVDGYALKPTADQRTEIEELDKEMLDTDAKIKGLIEEDLPRLNKLISNSGVPFIAPTVETDGRRGRNRGR